MTGEARPRPALGNPVHLLAFGFGAGLSPWAPGTFGTLVGVALYLPLALLPLVQYLAVVVALSVAGVWLCGRAARDLGVHDHPGIVWDEIAGYLVTMLAAPSGWEWVLAGFVLFRLFDIWKPWPIRWLDRRVAGGLGIMLDDLAAGALAAACIQIAAHWLGASGGG